MGVLLFALYIIVEDKFEECIIAFCAIIIIFLALLNAVKEPASDTVWYNEYYSQVAKYSFTKYVFLLGKEPVFGIFNWIIYQIIGINLPAYSFVITCISYFLLIYSVYRFGKANKYPTYNILFGIVAIAFIPYIYTQSTHGIRQFIANSLLAYIMVERIFYGKRMWLFMGLMFLVHSSSGIFIPLLFINKLKRPIGKGNLVIYVGIIIVILTYRVVGVWLMPLLGDNQSLSYVASRMAQERTGGMIMENYMITLNILTLVGILFCIYKRKTHRFYNGSNRFMHIVCFLIFYVLCNYDQDVISLRFNFYVWTLFPFIMMFCFYSLNFKSYHYYVMSLIIFLYSFYYLEYLGIWKYNVPMPVYKCSILYYF